MPIGPTSTLSGDYTGSSTYQTDVTPGDVVLNCRGLRIGTGGTLIYEDGNGSPHTITVGDKEYVPFWQGYGVRPNHPEPIRLFARTSRAS